MELLDAASKGDIARVEQLVSAGASVDVTDEQGRTALTQAAREGHLDVVRSLVERGAAVDARDTDRWTPLMRAAAGGHLDMVQYLVEHGAVVDARSIRGKTSLMRAAQNGHLDVVQYLVEHGAAVDDRENFGKTPLMYAAYGGHLDMVRFLVEHGAAVDASSIDAKTPLTRAAYHGNLDMVRFLVDHGAPVNASDRDCRTPLMRAAYRGNLDMVRFLVEHGAVVDASSIRGKTSLMEAAAGGHLDVVRFLVEHGAAVDASDSDRRTPLFYAAVRGHLDVVRFLVEHGAAVNAGDNYGETPLIPSADHVHLDVVRFLVEHGAAVNASDRRGQTSLIWAAHHGHLDMARVLVEHGAAVDDHNNNGETPLICAAESGHLDVMRFLVDHGAATDASEKDGETPLTRAAESGHLDVMRFLLERGAVVDASDKDGSTPLMLAARGGHLDVVRFLVEHGANRNLISAAGDTALSSAAKFDRQEVVQFLLSLVRYQDPRTQTEYRDEHEGRPSDIPSSWLIPPFEIEVEPFIDAGHIGGDYRGKWLDADVVVKLFIDDTTGASFVGEVRLWQQLRHPNVLKLYGVCDTTHHLFVCEYANKGTLPEYLKSCDVKNQTPWKFLHEAALGLEYLHERKIIHGSLRGSNILIGSDGLAKLSGFGLTGSSTNGSWYTSGAWVRWAAPESLRGNKVTFASDVYSLGMCIIEAVSGEIPYNESSDSTLRWAKCDILNGTTYSLCRRVCSTHEQEQLLLAMCCYFPHERPHMPAVVNKLERLAEIEAARLTQHTTQPEPEPLVTFDGFDEFNHGKMSSVWTAVQALVVQSENNLYRQIYHEMELIYNARKAKSHSWSTLQRFHDLLNECQLALDTISQQNRVYRLSATRARDHSVQGLHRPITQLLQLVHPQDQDTETRETEWKCLCREQIEIFVSEASEACVMLSSVDSEEDRSALVAVLRAELRDSDGKYTDKQLAALQKTCDDIVSKSLEDVHLATTPEWFIPWFELEMNEMATLGEGGFGSVFKARWLDSEVVVKKLEIPDKDAANDDKKREMRQMFEREVDIWFGLSHPHVVRLFGACHVGRPFFVCELAPNGTLVEYLRHHPDELWSKLREAVLGVQYLHARGIVHGDLKGNNIMIGSDGKAKVTDFGLSGVFGDDSTDFVVSGA